MNTVMTVLGPIPTEKLGVTLMHEHVTFAYPGWYADNSLAPYDRITIEAKLLKVFSDLKAIGVQTIVDATPADTGGRDPELLKRLSGKTGIHIIAATGLYTESSGGYPYFRWQSTLGGRDLEQDLYELFIREITVGIGTSGVKAGVLKVATSDPVITEYEKTVIKAAVRVCRETGVPIITHTDGATVGTAQEELFLGLGVNPEKIMIGHQNNSEDINYPLAELGNEGFYIAFDRTNPLSSPKAEDNILTLVKKGFASRIMLSHDCIFLWLGRPVTLPAEFKDWYPTYIHNKLIPKMKAAGIGDETIRTMLVDNPRRFFGGA
jgi:phosphotriesterase-related protein